MEETIKDAINFAPELVQKFILEMYEDLDADGRHVFRAILDRYFLDMGFNDEVRNVRNSGLNGT